MPLIIAKDIDSWAQKVEAPPDLPRLVRRLTMRAPGITLAIVPAGASIRQPGWDGTIDCIGGNAWVPYGRSYWEMSCRADVSTKANDDYKKRLEQTAPDQRARATFVFVSGRSWPGKATWLAAAKSKGEWADVRVYDADDLEHCLSTNQALRLPSLKNWGGVDPASRHPRAIGPPGQRRPSTSLGLNRSSLVASARAMP